MLLSVRCIRTGCKWEPVERKPHILKIDFDVATLPAMIANPAFQSSTGTFFYNANLFIDTSNNA